MVNIKNAELLKDDRVIKEIEQHKWIESEKVKKDIGFDQAAREWLNRYSDAWIANNLSRTKTPTRSAKRY